MSTYTPGPWTVSSEYGDSGEYTITEAYAPMGGGPISREEDHANARLIAAAPDLLEAMEALFENCAMIHMYRGEIDNTKQADAAILAARAAILKAKGE